MKKADGFWALPDAGEHGLEDLPGGQIARIAANYTALGITPAGRERLHELAIEEEERIRHDLRERLESRFNAAVLTGQPPAPLPKPPPSRSERRRAKRAGRIARGYHR